MKNDYRRTNLFPLAQLSAAFSAGILLSNISVPAPLFIGCAVLSTFGCFTFLICKRPLLATVSLFLAFTGCGATLALLELRSPESTRVKRLLDDALVKPGQPVEITGVLQRNPETSWDSVYLTFRVEQISINGSDQQATGVVSLVAPAPTDRQSLEELQVRYGARVRVMTVLERTNKFRNPGVFTFTEYLDRKGYDASASIKSLRLIERLDDERVFLPLAWVYDWRNHLQKQIDKRFSPDTAGVLDAALIGNRYNLSTSAEERFRDGGTFHVLVISGLHITFLGGLVFFVTSRFTRNRTTQFVVSVAIVWAYSIAVGAEPSILRAALMFSVVMLAPLVSRAASGLNGVGAVAVVLLVWKPSNLFDPSFQLTFVSVLAILVLARPLLHQLSAIGVWQPARATPYPPSCPEWVRRLAESLYWNEGQGSRHLERSNYKYRLLKARTAKALQRAYLQRLTRFVFAATVVSLSVQIALLPFLIIYFHRLSLASIVLNIFVGVVMAAVAFTALAGVALSQVSATLSEPLIVAANGLNWLMVHSVDPFARANVASIRLPQYTGWGFSFYVLYYAPLAICSYLLAKWQPLELPKKGKDFRRKRRFLWVALGAQLVAITLLIVHPASVSETQGKLRIDFLDVGQGDAALITFPDGSTVLVDGGGRPGPFKRPGVDDDSGQPQRELRSIGESVVSEYLWWRGLDRVDYLIASHADADHIDGLNDIVRNFRVRAGLVARVPSSDPEFAQMAQSLASGGVPLRLVGAGDELRFGNVSLRVLWPHPSDDSRLASANNDSLVLKIEFGNRSVLLLGDIESKAEQALVQKYHNQLTADVTKVAHHGSRTSSTEDFVRATRSRLGVISVGESSVFGHPHPEVIERWQANGAQVITTGHRGMITLVTDGQSMQLMTFVNP